MSRRDQLRALSAQIRTPAEDSEAPQPAQEPPQQPETTQQRPEPAPEVQRPPEPPAQPVEPSATTKTNLSLPPATAGRLRRWSESTGRSLADGIITALIDTGDELAEQCRTETRRVRLGLPALTPADGGERTTVTVRMPAPALAELDSTARNFGMTRSGLTAALLDLHLP